MYTNCSRDDADKTFLFYLATVFIYIYTRVNVTCLLGRKSCKVCVHSEHVFTISEPTSLDRSRRTNVYLGIGFYRKIEASFRLVRAYGFYFLFSVDRNRSPIPESGDGVVQMGSKCTSPTYTVLSF